MGECLSEAPQGGQSPAEIEMSGDQGGCKCKRAFQAFDGFSTSLRSEQRTPKVVMRQRVRRLAAYGAAIAIDGSLPRAGGPIGLAQVVVAPRITGLEHDGALQRNYCALVVTFCQKSRAEPAGVGRDARMRGNQPLKQR